MRKELKDTVCQVFYSVYLLFCQVFSLRVLVKSSVACVCVCVYKCSVGECKISIQYVQDCSYTRGGFALVSDSLL